MGMGRTRTVLAGGAVCTAALLATVAVGSSSASSGSAAGIGEPTQSSLTLKTDVLINADMWDEKPSMLAAGLGFTNIVGVPGLSTSDLSGSEQLTRDAGGTWNTVDCANGVTPSLANYTSANSPQGIAFGWGYPTLYASGLPIEFSWPIRPSTLDRTDFRMTLSTGEIVQPQAVAIYPNEEYNERSTVVAFAQFGNRIPSNQPGSKYVVKTQVVRDSTPLQLVGTVRTKNGGKRTKIVSAVGMSATAKTSPYDVVSDPDDRTGPHLTTAKLSPMSDEGESAPKLFASALPNDGVALYGSDAQWRLRMNTTGGFKPDGVRGVFPTDYETFFKVHVKGKGGKDQVLTKTRRWYNVNGHRLRVLGLADLGLRQQVYDDCYQDDSDNQIDIVLQGDKEAAERVTDLEIPSEGSYSPLYNPGGPGNNPTAGTSYTAPSPHIMQPVTIDLDNDLSVNFIHK